VIVAIPYSPTNPGQQIAGKVSWFGGPNDSSDSGHTASGATTAEPGIAVYNRATLGGYWEVTDKRSGKSAVLKQTDLGPSPSTGRAIDVTYSAIPQFGYTQQNFPTDSEFTAKYLGRSPSRAVSHAGPVMSATDAAIGHATAAAAVPASSATSGTPQTAAPVAPADDTAAILSRLLGSSSSAWDIGQPKVAALSGFDPASSLRAAGLFTTPAATDASPIAAATQPASPATSPGTRPASTAAGPVSQASSSPGRLATGQAAAAGLSQLRAPGRPPPAPQTFLHAAQQARTLPVSVQAHLYEGIPAKLKAGLALASDQQLAKFGYMREPGGDIVQRPGGPVKTVPVARTRPAGPVRLAGPLNQGIIK
jgi:hypothetical protein